MASVPVVAAQHRGCGMSTHSTRAYLPSYYAGFRKAGAAPGGQSVKGFFETTRAATASVRSTGKFRRQTTRMMPIGVPKVPYRTPKEGGWQWVDLWNCLYRERIIFLGKPIDEEAGNQLVATMLYLDSENKKDLNVYINCSGGEVVPCLALHDTMRHVRSDVATVGFGGCMGMMGFMLAMGKKGKRYALPNTAIMLHHPSGSARGQASDIQNESRELLRIRGYVNRALSEATGKPIEQVQKDFNRNKYFNSEEAKNYGIIDRILQPPRSSVLGVS